MNISLNNITLQNLAMEVSPNLYNKTRNRIFIYVAYRRPNGGNFLWTLMGGRGVS